MNKGRAKMNILVIFFILTIINVIFSTIKSIVTIRGNAFAASLVSALYYGYYNVVLIYTVADFPLWQKVAITFACNLVGVFVVKWAEAKARKDKLWKVEVTIPAEQAEQMIEDCKYYKLSYNYVDINKYYLFNFYCPTQKESENVKRLLKSYDVKYFVSETKNL